MEPLNPRGWRSTTPRLVHRSACGSSPIRPKPAIWSPEMPTASEESKPVGWRSTTLLADPAHLSACVWPPILPNPICTPPLVALPEEAVNPSGCRFTRLEALPRQRRARSVPNWPHKQSPTCSPSPIPQPDIEPYPSEERSMATYRTVVGTTPQIEHAP